MIVLNTLIMIWHQIFDQLNAYPTQNLVKRVGLRTGKLTLAKAPRTQRQGFGFNGGGAMMKDGNYYRKWVACLCGARRQALRISWRSLRLGESKSRGAIQPS